MAAACSVDIDLSIQTRFFKLAVRHFSDTPVAQASVAKTLASDSTRWLECAGLFGVALVGQACVLNLIVSPPWGVYHRYLPWKEVLGSSSQIFLIGLLIQTVTVLWATRAMRPEIKSFLGQYAFRFWILLLFMLFASVKFTADIPQYFFELVMASWLSLVSFLTIVLLAALIPVDAVQQVFRYWWRWAANRHCPYFVAAWVVVASASIAWLVLDRVPHIADDISYLFQAKYFSEGRLYLPAPPDKASFEVANVINDGVKWYGYGFPGWPAVLALGVLAGAPWIVNPLLAGLTVLLAYYLLKDLYSRSFAGSVISLLALSPWFLFMSASFMAHPLTLVWTLLSLLALRRAQSDGNGIWGICAGICVGGLFLTRPLEGILVGAVTGAWFLFFGDQGKRFLPLAGFATASSVVASLALAYNFILTGNALYAPHMKWTDETWYPGADRIGFGPTIGNLGWPHLDPLPGHGLLDVIINANSNVYMANSDLFGWSFGSLLFAAAAILWSRPKRGDWIFICVILATVLGHSFFWFSGGPDIGARYWYQTLIPLTVLSVRGALSLRKKLIPGGDSRIICGRVTTFVLVASLIGFVNVVPWRSVTKYYRYRGISADVDRLDQMHNFGNALVFVRQRNKEDYPSAFIFNPPSLSKGGPIYVLDAGPSPRAAVLRSFPSRPVWVVGRRSASDETLRVLARPTEYRDPGGQESAIADPTALQR